MSDCVTSIWSQPTLWLPFTRKSRASSHGTGTVCAVLPELVLITEVSRHSRSSEAHKHQRHMFTFWAILAVSWLPHRQQPAVASSLHERPRHTSLTTRPRHISLTTRRTLLLLDDEIANATTSVHTFAREIVTTTRDAVAFTFRVTPEYVDVGFGCVLYLVLNALSAAVEPVMPDGGVLRLLALAGFAAVQQFAGVPLDRWLRQADESRVDPNPFFQSGSPLAGVTFAFAFGLAVAVPAQLLGVPWVPAARELPEAGPALEKLFVAPLCEELFFRAWLLNALERAAPGSQAAGLVASSALFALYMVPLADVVSGGSNQLLLFEALGAYLAFLYQRSGGSLPFVVVTHCTFNALVTALRAAQVGSTLPF